MRMSMVDVRSVGMVVDQRHMPVRMTVRLRERFGMRVIVMLVVHVQMIMFQRFVHMQMAMPVSEEQKDSDRHTEAGEHIEFREALIQERNRNQSANEWCGGEVRSFSRCSNEA
jgi:hypothetical protein